MEHPLTPNDDIWTEFAKATSVACVKTIHCLDVFLNLHT